MAAPRFVLASASETCLRILRQAGFAPIVAPSDVDETIEAMEPSIAVSELALRKANAVAAEHRDDLVLGCDSLVDLDGRVLGKPSSRDEAIGWWRAMRDRSVTVWTGHVLVLGGRIELHPTSAEVTFGHPSNEEIVAYVATGEPMGAAGGFRLDGRAAAFVESVHGDPGTVHGVSIPSLRVMLGQLDIQVTDLWA